MIRNVSRVSQSLGGRTSLYSPTTDTAFPPQKTNAWGKDQSLTLQNGKSDTLACRVLTTSNFRTPFNHPLRASEQAPDFHSWERFVLVNLRRMDHEVPLEHPHYHFDTPTNFEYHPGRYSSRIYQLPHVDHVPQPLHTVLTVQQGTGQDRRLVLRYVLFSVP